MSYFDAGITKGLSFWSDAEATQPLNSLMEMKDHLFPVYVKNESTSVYRVIAEIHNEYKPFWTPVEGSITLQPEQTGRLVFRQEVDGIREIAVALTKLTMLGYHSVWKIVDIGKLAPFEGLEFFPSGEFPGMYEARFFVRNEHHTPQPPLRPSFHDMRVETIILPKDRVTVEGVTRGYKWTSERVKPQGLSAVRLLASKKPSGDIHFEYMGEPVEE
jgi:hypothetical protein